MFICFVCHPDSTGAKLRTRPHRTPLVRVLRLAENPDHRPDRRSSPRNGRNSAQQLHGQLQKHLRAALFICDRMGDENVAESARVEIQKEL